MAQPLTHTPVPAAGPAAPGLSAIALLEESAQLLRRLPPSILLCHWVGSVPFAMALLFFWNNLTSQRLSDRDCARQALVLALATVWMNSWRAVFAGLVRSRLSGAPPVAWNWTRVSNLVAAQSSLGAAKLVIVPLAGLVMFPFANAVAFFRTAAALSAREDLDPMALVARSRALARIQPRQSWGMLPVLALLYLVIAANLALVYVILPTLLRMLTGYESEFNRGAEFLAQSPLFVVFVLVSAWVLFDPFVQTAYCARCFHAESVATGEDLLVGLRRLRATKALAALMLLAALPHLSAQGVSPQELGEASRQAMQAPEYGWRIPPPPPSGIAGRPWMLRAADKVLEVLNGAWRAIAKAIGKIIEWIFGKLVNTAQPQGGTAPAAGLHWSIYLALAGLAIAAILILRRYRLMRRTARPRPAAPVAASVRIDEEGITADQLPDERWLEIALQCFREGKYRLAVRAYYLATLAWLGQHDFIAIHAGKTNREYELELRRKAQRFAEARNLFAANVSAFESAWYGMHDVSSEGVLQFRARLDSMKKQVSSHASPPAAPLRDSGAPS